MDSSISVGNLDDDLSISLSLYTLTEDDSDELSAGTSLPKGDRKANPSSIHLNLTSPSGFTLIAITVWKIHNVVEEEDGEQIRFLGGNSSSGTKKYRGSNSNDGGNIGDGVKIAGEVIGYSDEIELGIQDHSNEPSSSKLVPKSCSLSKQDSYITTRVGITIPPSHSNAEDNSHKVVRLGINPMIQPEPEDLPKDNPKLEIAVLSDAMHKPFSAIRVSSPETCLIVAEIHTLSIDISSEIVDID
ncbi:hypothetical protein Tco_0875557 [Tanacetum coccineum]|uniref:Uncharacterized protein n=1 Tax=Tanacetum coccineum TaxID=301880 RepID=A0ABQ5BPQ3_9ASTR